MMPIDTLKLFQSFRTILCVCPHCQDILRLADLHLKYKGKSARTWLDTYEGKVRTIDRKEEAFDEKEAALREAATERGRKKVPHIVRKSLSSEFTALRYDPYDIKAILHPVDFVVFNGLDRKESLNDIVFLSRRTESQEVNTVRKSIERTIDKGDYSWQVARVDINGKIDFSVK